MAVVKKAASSTDAAADFNLRILKLERRLERERLARLQAEMIAEKGLSDLYEKQRQLGLLQDIAAKANQSSSVDDTFRFALEAICRHTDCSFGNVYMVSEDGPRRLLPTPICYAGDSALVDAFIEDTRATKFNSGIGIPGRVLESGKAVWVSDVTQDSNFPRSASAKACGLHAAFAAPVLVGDEVLAVIEFFFRDVLETDEALLGVMAQIGTQLGRVLERRRSEDKLIHDATHDPLTGLPNRLLFTDRLEHAVAAYRRRPDIGFAVLFIDLDHFKLVNDSLGHAAGDALLLEIAERLSTALTKVEERQSYGAVATLARLGGDEFTVLLEDVNDSTAAVEIADRLIDTLKRPLIIEGQEVYTSASIGVAHSNTHYENASDIMRDADLAMYRAKSEGRGRVEVFDKSLHATAMLRLSLESDLRRALQNEEFLLQYQPIYALESGELAGFEALVRWRRRTGAIVPPSDFIGVAEDTGLIVFLGKWVMRKAFAALAQWQRADPREAPLTMSVNVSPRQFLQSDFVDQVKQAVAESGASPETIRLEITENVTVQDAHRTADILTRLRDFGVRVSIDDFGTGYSSLSYLQQLPFDTLKIDRSFVNALQGGSEGAEIVQTILDLARNLGLDVVAEGAETEIQASQLRQMGCQYVQGYYFSRPLDEDAAGKLIDR